MARQVPWAVAAVAIAYLILHRPAPPAWQPGPSPAGPRGGWIEESERPAPSPRAARMEPWMDFDGVMVESELARIGARMKERDSLVDFWRRAPGEASAIRRRIRRIDRSLGGG